MKLVFWAMASHGVGISGGDRIYIEFARRWSKSHQTSVVTWDEGVGMMHRNGLNPGSGLSFIRIKVPPAGFLITYLARIILSVFKALTITIEDPEKTALYTASEFWMDSIPGVILKLRYPKLSWVATWFQTAPSPLLGFGQGRYRFNALLLWLTQLPIKPLFAWLADYVLVNNEMEKNLFKKSVVVLGAVDTQVIDKWLENNKSLTKIYDAVFQGRFHAQKGVIELVDIWNQVVSKKPKARLIMIGDGPLMGQVRKRIQSLGLQKNIQLEGFLFDGPKKFKIFAQSKVVVHPSYFDSGGMASAEAMAFGLPCVGFDLPAYASYYPEGMLKVHLGDIKSFSSIITKLLDDPILCSKLGKTAGAYIHRYYSWDIRADQIKALVLK